MVMNVHTPALFSCSFDRLLFRRTYADKDQMSHIKMICFLGSLLMWDIDIDQQYWFESERSVSNEEEEKKRSNCACDNSNKTTTHTKNPVQNVQTNVPAPVKSYHGTCVLNYYASGSTCKLTEEMIFYVFFFSPPTSIQYNLSKWSYWKWSVTCIFSFFLFFLQTNDYQFFIWLHFYFFLQILMLPRAGKKKSATEQRSLNHVTLHSIKWTL